MNSRNYKTGKSNIEGTGVFTTMPIHQGQTIGVGIWYYLGIIPIVSSFGSKINHSWSPTTEVLYDKKNWIYNVIAKYDLEPNTEVTVDYRNTPNFIKKPDPNWK